MSGKPALCKTCNDQAVEEVGYELPSDFSGEDEEIDENTAFTPEDEERYAGWFSNKGKDRSAALIEASEEEEPDADDFSEEVPGFVCSSLILSSRLLRVTALDRRHHKWPLLNLQLLNSSAALPVALLCFLLQS